MRPLDSNVATKGRRAENPSARHFDGSELGPLFESTAPESFSVHLGTPSIIKFNLSKLKRKNKLFRGFYSDDCDT